MNIRLDTPHRALERLSELFVAQALHMVEIARRIPLLRPVTVFARFAPGRWAAEKLYRAVANHRLQISRVLGMSACKRPDHAQGHPESQPRMTGQHP